VLHGIKNIFPRHTALLGKQYGFESPVFGVCKQATKLGSVGRLGACQSMVFVPRGDSESVAFGHGLDVASLTRRAILLLIGAHADVANRWF
jgi:hypothetical protein